MARTHTRQHLLSNREKVLTLIAATILLVMAIAAFANIRIGAANVLISQAIPNPPDQQGGISVDDRKNQEQSLKGWQDSVRDFERRRSDIERELKQSQKSSTGSSVVNFVLYDQLLGEFRVCINELGQTVGSSVFWDKNRECEDKRQTVDREWNDNVQPARECANHASNFAGRRKEKKDNLDRQLKDMSRNYKTADISRVNEILAKIESLLTQGEQLIAGACTQGVIDQLKDINSEVDYAFRDAYDILNETRGAAEDKKRGEEAGSQLNRDYKKQCEKDMGREFKNLDKEFSRLAKKGAPPAGAQAGYDAAKEIYDQLCVEIFGRMQTAVRNNDIDTFEEERNNWNDLQQEVWTKLQEARESFNKQQQLGNVSREISQQKKELERMKKEYERGLKKGVENAEMKQVLDDLGGFIDNIEKNPEYDPQDWWSGDQQTFNEKKQEYYEGQQKVNEAADIGRWVKDIERELKDREKELNRMQKECPDTATQIADLLNQAKQIIADAKEQAVEDPDAARDSLQFSMDDLRQTWDETSRMCWGKKQMLFEIEKTKREIDFAKGEIEKAVSQKRLSEEEAQACRDFIEQEVKPVFERAKDMPNPEDMEDIGRGLEERAVEVCPFFEQFGKGAPPPDAAFYKQYVEENVTGIDENVAASLLEKVSGDMTEKIIAKLLSNPEVIKKLVEGYGMQYEKAAGALKSVDIYDEQRQAELLNLKTQILEANQQLEQLTSQLQIAKDKVEELRRIKEELAGYNFVGNAGEEVKGDVAEFMEKMRASGVNKEQIKAGIEELKVKVAAAKDQARQEKFDKGYIPFLDTDDDFWGTAAVKKLATVGVLRGKGGGMFDSAGKVTVGEMLAIAARLNGSPDGETGESEVCGAKYDGNWVNPYIVWAEEKGLSIVQKCPNVNRPALKWEVARILLESAGIEIGDESQACFNDVRAGDRSVNSVVCKALEAGVIAGTNGASNAYKDVNRTEAAVMAVRTAEKMGVNFSRDNNQTETQGNPETTDENDYDLEDEDL